MKYLYSMNITCLLISRSKCSIRQNIYDTFKNAEFKRDLKPCVPQKSNEDGYAGKVCNKSPNRKRKNDQ